eukprot:GFUD01046935.1.p1 GENE.GFUD01046935.1~~GFUD01046935.1.p1  ORF type:complete len:336 (-),score=80.89 GFUD01046935.1:102-1109(-)
MVVLMQLVMSTFLIWKTQRNIDCNNQVFCFLINKLHKNLAGNKDSVFVSLEDDFQTIFMKTAVVNLADENEDDQASLGEIREKSVKYLRDLFALLDANNDNFLVENECTIHNVSFSEIKQAVTTIFKIFDQNRDEEISTEDFPNKESFDLNKDRIVTFNEVIKKASDGRVSNIIFLPRPFQTLINKLDSIRDEKISIKEFERFTNELFNVLDDDNDCHISLDEVIEVVGGNKVAMKTILKPYTSVIEEFLKNLIKKADLNNDDKIDLYEIIDFKDFKFLTDSLESFKRLGYPKLNRSSRSRWANILEIKDDVSLWLTVADRLLQRKEFNNQTSCL